MGVPVGYAIARGRFRGRTTLLGAVNTGMGMPPVVVGLIVWLLLVRSGPFGDLGLIYTQTAMVIAQFLIATPDRRRLHGGIHSGAAAPSARPADGSRRRPPADAVAPGA